MRICFEWDEEEENILFSYCHIDSFWGERSRKKSRMTRMRGNFFVYKKLFAFFGLG